MYNFERSMNIDFIIFAVRSLYFYYYGLLMYLFSNTYYKKKKRRKMSLALCWIFDVLKIKNNSFMLTSCKKFFRKV